MKKSTTVMHVLGLVAPYLVLVGLWAAIAYTKMTVDGLQIGHDLILMFAALVEPGRRAVQNIVSGGASGPPVKPADLEPKD